MKVTGFTIIRNAFIYDYPIEEAIRSILPLCTDFVVAVGKSDDETRKLIEKIDPVKIRIIDTVWDDSMRDGGKVLALETNKAFNEINADSDWCFYIQGDEVLHEKFHEPVKNAMLEWKDDKNVEGLVFDYLHFYGSYDYTGDSRNWYTKEVRIIRKDAEIYSFRDAQGFQKYKRPLNVKKSNASIFHYGWVKHPKFQQQKQLNFNKLWHDDAWIEKNVERQAEFDYSNVDSVALFKGTHPLIMQPRIKAMNWQFSMDPTQKKLSFKNKLHYYFKKIFGWSIGEYKNYRLLK